MTPLERAQAFNDVINQITAQIHLLIEADLYAAADELARCRATLSRQWELYVVGEGSLADARKR